MNKRYIRQSSLIGETGQEKLGKSKILILGVGALGSVTAEMMVRAGVGSSGGSIVLVDRDVVELSNLQRQTLYSEEDLGSAKVVAAKRRLSKINSEVKIKIFAKQLSLKNIEEIIGKDVDLILDCTDNMTTRFLINDYAHKNKIDWIFASAVAKSGMLSLIKKNNQEGEDNNCLRCQMPENAHGKTCAETGVMATITNIIASLQSNISIEKLAGFDLKKFENKLFNFDLENMKLREFKVKRNDSCDTCLGKYPSLSETEGSKIIKFCSTGNYQVNEGREVDLEKLRKITEREFEKVILDEVSLRFGPMTLFFDGRALIKAKSEEEAISFYNKYIEC